MVNVVPEILSIVNTFDAEMAAAAAAEAAAAAAAEAAAEAAAAEAAAAVAAAQEEAVLPDAGAGVPRVWWVGDSTIYDLPSSRSWRAHQRRFPSVTFAKCGEKVENLLNKLKERGLI